MPHVVRADERRPIESPAGVMTTHASPTLGGTEGLSLWEVRMPAGANGPLHVFDSEQIWTVLDGQVSVTVDHRSDTLSPDDTIVIPKNLKRQVTANTDVRLLVCGHSDAVPQVPGESAPRATPAWIA